MKKYLIVAHPDDEVVWFNPLLYDKIFIAFLDRSDNIDITDGRKKVLKEHTLRNKIICFAIKESNYWRNKNKEKEFKQCYDELIKNEAFEKGY